MASRKPARPGLPPAEERRQSQITHLTYLLLGRERAIAFLNEDNPGLGGRPLAVATASEQGRASIEAELARLTLR
jgi:hypothetical protein